MRELLALARSLFDVVMFLAPIAIALIAIVLTLLFWPGAVVGTGILLVVAWWCHKRAQAISREHHW